MVLHHLVFDALSLRGAFFQRCWCDTFILVCFVGHFIPQATKVREYPTVETDFTSVGSSYDDQHFKQ